MKKIFLNFMMAIAMLSTVAVTSCSDKDDKPEPVKPTEDNKLAGTINDTKTLKADVVYNLVGPLLVEEGGVLNIPAGTVIKAKKGFGNYILVLQGGKININGTADKPVTMTADVANAEPAHWGGLVINGRAPLAGKTTGSTEISSAYKYGGDNAADNSGSITYLKLEYTGARSSANVEHNGLTLNGVGSGTKIENVYVPHGADDGVEFFGGTVNVKNLLVVNSDDDMFDVTQGWSGTLENCYGIWETGYTSSESDPRGVEADGNLDGGFPNHTGQSNFKIKNMTIELKLAASTEDKHYMHDAIKIRRGAKAIIENALIKGTGQVKDLVDFSDKKGDGNPASVISITNKLSTELSGNEVKGEGTVNKVDKNAGCDKGIFAWTGYKL